VTPGPGSSAYLLTREISRTLAAARDRYLGHGVHILDVGCGPQPYRALFTDLAATYDGSDVVPGPSVRYVCPAEALEVADESYDLVLCTQVLHLLRSPQRALEEFMRVLVPGGYVFATTHGVYPYHPGPRDYWRWTQDGLPALVEDVVGLELVELVAHGGSGATFAMIVNTPIRELGRALGSERIGAPIIALVNVVGALVDRTLPSRARAALIPNFLVVARRV
jgi:SAM-dependent methyltransferase